ncbi:FkbM family methyltransferase [Bradyrhizobium sp. 18BD]
MQKLFEITADRSPIERIASRYEDARFLMRSLRYRFRTERLQLKTLARLRLTGATVLDIGANKGIYAFWLARAVGPAGKVLAFDPQPEMIDYIAVRRAQFGWQNILPVNVALSNDEGVAKLSRKRAGDGSASLSRTIGTTLSVPTKRLDSFNDLSNLKYIKCDVEGHELNVSRGAELTIRRFRPVIQFESTPPEDVELFRFFEGLGYSGIMFLGDRYLPCSNPEQVPHYKFGLGGHRDFLFFRPEALGSIIPENIFSRFPKASFASG